MKRLVALGLVALGGAITVKYLPRGPRAHLGDMVGRRIMKRMEQMMASLPEGAPPKLVMSVLPRLQAQNDQIIAMLQEQNELLRQQVRVA
jgi:hypothetical protein